MAASSGHEGCVRLLVEAGAEKRVKDRWHETALDQAKSGTIRAMLMTVEEEEEFVYDSRTIAGYAKRP